MYRWSVRANEIVAKGPVQKDMNDKKPTFNPNKRYLVVYRTASGRVRRDHVEALDLFAATAAIVNWVKNNPAEYNEILAVRGEKILMAY